MKKTLALLLAVLMCVAVFAGCAAAVENAPAAEPEAEAAAPAEGEAAEGEEEAAATSGPEPDWTEYNALIAEIKSTTDFAKRAEMMHQAEDILMGTGAIVPIYYYNDMYMQKAAVQGIYANAFQTKFFQYATNGDSDTLKVNLASEPDKLDPALNSSVDGACLASMSFGGLYTYNEKGELIPNFAEGYTMSEDGLTYTFTVKEGLKWSDGSDLTAADFEYAWKRAANPQTAADYSYMLNVIDGYYDAAGETVGDINVKAEGNTLTVVLSAPCAYMLDLVAFPTYFPVKQTSVESAEGYLADDGTILAPGAWATEAGFISCGPFKLTAWTHDESMVYEKNEYWYDAANVKLNKIEFMLSADDVAIYAAYNDGSIDFADTIPTSEVASKYDAATDTYHDPEFKLINALGTYYMCFNVKSPLFEGKTAEQAAAMRRAFGLLIDRQYIIDTVGQCGQKIATSFLPADMMDGNGGTFKDANAWAYPNGEDGYFPTEVDVAGAIELLKSAGFEFDGEMLSANTPISFEYLTNESTGHVAIAECMQQDLAMVGITMTIKSIDWDTFLSERKAGNYDVARNGWIADFNDPINMLEMWTTESGNNDCQFGR